MFIERGFRGTSVHEIAAAAGYTTGAIYSNFKGKDGLFVAVAEHRSARVLEQFRLETLESASSSTDAALTLGAALTRLTPEPAWVVAFYEFFSHAARDEELHEQMARMYRAATMTIREVLGAVCSSPPLPLDRLAFLILALTEGSILASFINPDETADALISDGVALLLGTSTVTTPEPEAATS